MAYCENCGAETSTNANFCPNCGCALNGNNTQTQSNNANQPSDTAKTILTAAGTAAGVSLLGNALRRRRRRYMMPPHGGMMGGPMMGRPGMHGHRMHGPMGGRGRGPGRGGHGGMGGPGGRW